MTSNDTLSRRLRIAAIIAGIVVACFAAFIGSYFFFSLIDSHFGFHTSGMVHDLMVFAAALLILGGSGVAAGLVTAPKQMAVWVGIMSTLKQISQGNFNVNVHLDAWNGPDSRWHEFVDSINNMADGLRQHEQMRQEFISNVSHEIQSPLTSITGFAQALKNQDLSDDKRLHYLDIIETESIRLSKLSENLLKLTSLESQHHPFHPEPFHANQQLQSVILSLEPQWMEKQIEVEANLDTVVVEADKDLLNQVWFNLLVNAIKFTSERGTIVVSLHREENGAVVTVSDSGVGIPESDLERIFERFFKVDKSRNRNTPGSGLGLAIVKKIVDMHNGTIEVTSTPGIGTTFTVHVPDKQP